MNLKKETEKVWNFRKYVWKSGKSAMSPRSRRRPGWPYLRFIWWKHKSTNNYLLNSESYWVMDNKNWSLLETKFQCLACLVPMTRRGRSTSWNEFSRLLLSSAVGSSQRLPESRNFPLPDSLKIESMFTIRGKDSWKERLNLVTMVLLFSDFF